MPEYQISIIGGETYDSKIRTIFEEQNIKIQHYRARKGSDLRKQSVNKNTIGVIITVDRSHMTFGNSNDLPRDLRAKNIPFVFSNSNLASINSARILLNKINEKYPETFNKENSLSNEINKLDNWRSDWNNIKKEYIKLLEEWFNILESWETEVESWKKILNDWKFKLKYWKDLQKNKKFKKNKRHNINLFNQINFSKEQIHQYGIQIEREINLLNEWQKNIDEMSNTISLTQDKNDKLMKLIKDINKKDSKPKYNKWKHNYFKLYNDLPLWKSDFLEWENITKDLTPLFNKWQEEINIWFQSVSIIDN